MNVLEDRLFREKSAELVSQSVAADAILIMTSGLEMYHMLCIIHRYSTYDTEV